MIIMVYGHTTTTKKNNIAHNVDHNRMSARQKTKQNTKTKLKCDATHRINDNISIRL
jgi:hypothetical protein